VGWCVTIRGAIDHGAHLSEAVHLTGEEIGLYNELPEAVQTINALLPHTGRLDARISLLKEGCQGPGV